MTRRTRQEHEETAQAWNRSGRRCRHGHAGEWKGYAHSPVCAECHRVMNRGWRQRTTAGVHPPARSRAAAPKPAGEWREGQRHPAEPRPSRYGRSGFAAPPDELYVLPWNRGIGPEEPTRR